MAGPPAYKDPTQTPPVLDSITPDVAQVQSSLTGGELFKISFVVRSEDVGDSLVAALYLDQKLQQGTVLPIAASTFDSPRTVNLNWTVPTGAPGCHALTLFVTHSKNTQLGGYRDPADVALATWVLNVDDQTNAQHPDGTNTLAQCPAGGVPGGAPQ